MIERPGPEPRWRRAPTLSILAIWVPLTAVLALIGATVPARLLGTAASPTMREIERGFTVFSVLAAPVAALVWSILAYSLIAWRHHGHEPPLDDVPAVRGHRGAQAAWYGGSAVLLLVLLIWGVATTPSSAFLPGSAPAAAQTDNGEPPLVVEVTGQQWVWSFAYPDRGGVESDALYLPVNRPVTFRVTSRDVVHSFWIVELGVKIDANPGQVTTISVLPDRPGSYTIRCAELCGLSHSYMQTKAHVVTAAEFDTYLAEKAVKPVTHDPNAPQLPVPTAPTPGPESSAEASREASATRTLFPTAGATP